MLLDFKIWSKKLLHFEIGFIMWSNFKMIKFWNPIKIFIEFKGIIEIQNSVKCLTRFQNWIKDLIGF